MPTGLKEIFFFFLLSFVSPISMPCAFWFTEQIVVHGVIKSLLFCLEDMMSIKQLSNETAIPSYTKEIPKNLIAVSTAIQDWLTLDAYLVANRLIKRPELPEIVSYFK